MMVTPCSEHVFQLPLSSPTLLPATTTNTYLIVAGGECMIVDPGHESHHNTDTILAAMKNLGDPRLKGVIFTHYHKDHSPGVRGIAERVSFPVLCHKLEREAVEPLIHPVVITQTLEHNDILKVGDLVVKVFHTPGHTPGHIALFVEDDQNLITGDTVINQGSTWIGPPDGHLRTYLESLKFLKTVPANKISPGHGTMIHNPKEAIDWFINRRLNRENQILDLFKTNSTYSVKELVALIYMDQVHPSALWVAEKTVLGHLIKLEEDGLIHEISDSIAESHTHPSSDAMRTFQLDVLV